MFLFVVSLFLFCIACGVRSRVRLSLNHISIVNYSAEYSARGQEVCSDQRLDVHRIHRVFLFR